MTCRNQALLKAPRNPSIRLGSSRASLTRTRQTYGRWALPDRTLLLRARTQAFDGRMTRSSLTTAAGTGRTRITITTGTILFTTASAIPAGTIRLFLATITFTALTLRARRSATTAWVIRSGWRPGQSGLVAVTWT